MTKWKNDTRQKVGLCIGTNEAEDLNKIIFANTALLYYVSKKIKMNRKEELDETP